MADRGDEFRKKHEELTRRLGRCPTRTEMCAAMGWNLYSSHCYKAAKRLGLELRAERKAREKGEVPAAPGAASPDYDFGHRAAPSMQRIMEIREGTGIGEGKGWGHSPAEGYGVTDRKMIVCPVCGTRKLIAPRMHPFWLRDKQGKVVFVCSRGCTGQAMT